MKIACRRLAVLLVAPFLINVGQTLEIKTTAPNKLLSASQLQDFLARPVHWPQIVASSDRVQSSSSKYDVTLPMKPGKTVLEYFGLGLLSVEWICRQSKPGTFLVESPKGVPGIAKDCSMDFDIQDDQVTLTMGYTPESPIAILGTPVLVVDNWIALNVLLPAAVDPNPLDSFRKLMGGLYGVAGIAHLVDLLVGPSQLFTSVGIPPFQDLDLPGQAYALLWCAVGPLAYIASRQSSPRIADTGLIIYGLVEVLGAFLSSNSEAFVNAIAVQAIVLGAWVYSSSKDAVDAD